MLQRVSPDTLAALGLPMLADAAGFRLAMRHFAGSVCVLTADGDQGPTGCVASSVSSFSAAPPVLALSLAQQSSTAQALRVGSPLGISLLAPEDEAVAQRFSGFTGVAGSARFAGSDWLELDPGAQVLASAVVGLGCAVEEMIPRHGQVLVLARVCAIAPSPGQRAPLLYWHGAYRELRDGGACAGP